jgi:hypothetical protein
MASPAIMAVSAEIFRHVSVQYSAQQISYSAELSRSLLDEFPYEMKRALHNHVRCQRECDTVAGLLYVDCMTEQSRRSSQAAQAPN